MAATSSRISFGAFDGEPGVERRLRVVLDAELDRLGDLGPVHPTDEREREVDAGRHAGGRRRPCPRSPRAARSAWRRSRRGRRTRPSASSPAGRRGGRRRRGGARRCTPRSSTSSSRARRGSSRRSDRRRAASLRVMNPPGTRSTSGAGTSSKVVLDVEMEQAVVVADPTGFGGAEHDLGAGQVREHLVGADDVEGGEGLVEPDGDLHGRPPVLCGFRVTPPGGGSAGGSGRRRADPALEGPVQRLTVAHADGRGDGGDRVIRRLEQPPRRLDPERFDERGGCRPGLGAEGAGEVAGAHAGALGEGGDGKLLGEVVGQPALHGDDAR